MRSFPGFHTEGSMPKPVLSQVEHWFSSKKHWLPPCGHTCQSTSLPCPHCFGSYVYKPLAAETGLHPFSDHSLRKHFCVIYCCCKPNHDLQSSRVSRKVTATQQRNKWNTETPKILQTLKEAFVSLRSSAILPLPLKGERKWQSFVPFFRFAKRLHSPRHFWPMRQTCLSDLCRMPPRKELVISLATSWSSKRNNLLKIQRDSISSAQDPPGLSLFGICNPQESQQSLSVQRQRYLANIVRSSAHPAYRARSTHKSAHKTWNAHVANKYSVLIAPQLQLSMTGDRPHHPDALWNGRNRLFPLQLFCLRSAPYIALQVV